ncbi:MAG: acylphosphatase [Cyanobacteria bacterium SBLK]|nr:acylphosphatase [Cyanobacteria bacterium SBLK]
MEQIRVRVWISGKVQGVGYRYFTLLQGRELGVKGWVRNLTDGRVQAVFEGDRETVEAMVKWCDRGSPAARVREVVVELEEWEGLAGFDILY